MNNPTSATWRATTAELDAEMRIPAATIISPAKPMAGIGAQVQRIGDRSARNDARNDASDSFRTRFTVLNLIGLALVAAAWVEGLAAKPYRADVSGMCILITALFLWGLWRTFRRDWLAVRWIGNTLVYLGMVGTVLGLIVTVSELTVDGVQNFDNFTTIISAIFIGSGTALYTNLLACIGYLWLGTNAHLLSGEEI
jgi:hypothetical protein